MAKLVSVIVAVHNGQRYLAEQLDTILAQSHEELEVIVLNDRSTDRSQEVLRAFAARDPRVRVISNEKNLGITANFLKGCSLATGEYGAFSDQDDVWRTDKLEVLLGLLEGSGGNVLAYSDLEVCDEALKGRGSFWHSAGIRPRQGDLSELAVLKNVAPGCSMLFNKAVLERLAQAFSDKDFMAQNAAQTLDETPFMHDQLALVVASLQGRVVYTPEKLVKYRQHGSNRIGVDYEAAKAEGRFRRLLARKIELLESARFMGNSVPKGKLERFYRVSSQGGLWERLGCLKHYLFLRNDTFQEHCLGFLECVSPGVYAHLKEWKR